MKKKIYLCGLLPVLFGCAAIDESPAIPADIYKVTVTRKAQDVYQTLGGVTYIKTRYCDEDVFADEAILRLYSPGRFHIGKIIFSSGRTCDVESVFPS
jgi:hypothetical protein